MKIWENGEFTSSANAIMYVTCWLLGIAGFIAGSM